MKRYILWIGVFLILFLSAPEVSSFATTVYAVKTAHVAVALATPTPTPMPKPVEYVLPYPGMLPDNPLYVLKNFRDRIIEFLISNPVNKAEFYILQADKKLSMGISLAEMGKKEEAHEILSEALAARTKAVTMLETAGKVGKTPPAFVIEKMMLSLEKHKEVLSGLGLPTDALNGLFTNVQELLRRIK